MDLEFDSYGNLVPAIGIRKYRGLLQTISEDEIQGTDDTTGDILYSYKIPDGKVLYLVGLVVGAKDNNQFTYNVYSIYSSTEPNISDIVSSGTLHFTFSGTWVQALGLFNAGLINSPLLILDHRSYDATNKLYLAIVVPATSGGAGGNNASSRYFFYSLALIEE